MAAQTDDEGGHKGRPYGETAPLTEQPGEGGESSEPGEGALDLLTSSFVFIYIPGSFVQNLHSAVSGAIPPFGREGLGAVATARPSSTAPING